MQNQNTRSTPAFRRFVQHACVIALLGAGALSVSAGRNLNPGILPPNSHPNGKSYSQWAAAWWQWALSFPADANPILDPTGALCPLGDQGPVWFLAGGSGGVVERTCTVPAGKALFFPIYNWVNTHVPGTDLETIDELRDFIRPLASAGVVSCEVDGRPVQDLADYREESVVFDLTLPEGNLFGLDAGLYGPAVDDGYYLMLAPLTPGRHTLHFEAHAHDAGLELDFDLELTYHLTVTKK